MKEQTTISIVLLSYGRPHFLREALRSVFAQTHKPAEVVIVDNESASSDDIARLVVEAAREAGAGDRVRLLRPGANLGFAGGMNLGIREARGRYVYLTEDDIVLADDCLSVLVEQAEGDGEDGGLLSPVIYNRGEGTIRCAGGELALGGVFRNRIHGADERDTGQFTEAFDVAFVPGSAIFCELEYMRRLGGFREDFFMYSEDRELCARVAKSGRRITVVPRAKVYHFEPACEGVSGELEFHMVKNFYSLYLIHAPLRVLPEFACRYVVLQLFRSAVGAKRDTARVLRAWWWVAKNAGRLLEGRRRAGRLRHDFR